jgi:hypothetical protein
MMAPRNVLAPVTIADMLTMTMELSGEQFDVLEKDIRSPEAFEATDGRSARLAKILGLDQEKVGYLLSFLGFVYHRLQDEGGLEKAGGLEALFPAIAFEPDNGQSEADHSVSVGRLRKRLSRIAEFNEYAELRTKVDRLKDGFLPNAVAFSSFVDLRPVFDEDRESYKGFVLTTQLRISTEQVDKAQGASFVVQLTPQAIYKLADAVADAKKKLALLQSDDFLAPRIMN